MSYCDTPLVSNKTPYFLFTLVSMFVNCDVADLSQLANS